MTTLFSDYNAIVILNKTMSLNQGTMKNNTLSEDEPFSEVTFFLLAYFIPVTFLVIGIIIVLATVTKKIIKKLFSDHSGKGKSTSIYKNYGTCRSGLINYHLVPSTSRVRSTGAEYKPMNNETLSKQLEVKLQGDDISHNDSSSKNSKIVKEIETPTITKIV